MRGGVEALDGAEEGEDRVFGDEGPAGAGADEAGVAAPLIVGGVLAFVAGVSGDVADREEVVGEAEHLAVGARPRGLTPNRGLDSPTRA
jgi:hypothetical protein